jgi:tRNA-modifying protein YgfZ
MTAGYFEMPRGLIAVWGKEAVQFLDGMVTNDVKTLRDGGEMLAAFPNAQGRLLAVVRIRRDSDRFLIETENATRERVFQNLFRFTSAGDFFVEDLSESYRFFASANAGPHEAATGIAFTTGRMGGFFARRDEAIEVDEMTAGSYETLRVESGVPLFGSDMDETTIVPELGFDEMISYKKGCYIGQEIIARIHFRGHVAKKLIGLVLSEPSGLEGGQSEITTQDGKNAGRITSGAYSPTLGKTIALGYVRYDYLAAGTELRVGDALATVTELPFIK